MGVPQPAEAENRRRSRAPWRRARRVHGLERRRHRRRCRPIALRAGAAGLGLGLGAGVGAVLGASALLGQYGMGLGAGCGAFLLLAMILGPRVAPGATLTLTAACGGEPGRGGRDADRATALVRAGGARAGAGAGAPAAAARRAPGSRRIAAALYARRGCRGGAWVLAWLASRGCSRLNSFLSSNPSRGDRMTMKLAWRLGARPAAGRAGQRPRTTRSIRTTAYAYFEVDHLGVSTHARPLRPDQRQVHASTARPRPARSS